MKNHSFRVERRAQVLKLFDILALHEVGIFSGKKEA